MEINKYGIISLVVGLILFFGTYFAVYSGGSVALGSGIIAVLLTLLYGGLLWLGIFFFLIGLLMLVL
ncbi:MAG TPA: hypothetical protein VJI71_02625 [Candidatus Norongarragalinales archaeon]|nr:hypothetical protein [Candidatus Norongarragalinales archaeon]